MSILTKTKEYESSERIEEIQEYLKGKNIVSNLEKKQYFESHYDEIISALNIKEYQKQLETQIEAFLEILFAPTIKPNLKQILLKLIFPNDILSYIPQYLICLIYKDDTIYRNTAGILKKIIDNTNNERLKAKTEEEIHEHLKKYFYIKNDVFNRELLPTKEPERFKNKEVYDSLPLLYKQHIDNIGINFFAIAEQHAYLSEIESLKKLNIQNRVRWVARYDGDTYHYDILSYDPIKDREKIIEVKSTPRGNDKFSLSFQEYQSIPSFIENADYYVYFYRVIDNTEENIKNGQQPKALEIRILSYVNENTFIDQDGIEYQIEYQERFDRGYYQVSKKEKKLTL